MKILILSCSTGGGHNAAAYAIKEQFDMQNVDCDVKEFLDIFNIRMAKIINNAYIKATTNNGMCFKCVYKLGELYDRTNLISPVYSLNSITKKKLYKYIIENEYDYVVATHLFPAQALTALRKKCDIGFVAIATDYESIPFWKEVCPDYFIIPHKDLIDNFVQRGIDKNKLIPMGIPVSDNYSRKIDRKGIINELKLNDNKKYILVMSGSMGFGKIEEIIYKLDKSLDGKYCIIAACGNNTEMVKKIEINYTKGRIIALPFTKEIYKYIRICEVVLSKPGGLSTTEICTANIPLIHTMPIPGCETKNADFFESKGMSIKCETVDEIVSATKKLLNDNDAKEYMINCQRKNIDRYSASHICDYIIKHMNDNILEKENIKNKSGDYS